MAYTPVAQAVNPVVGAGSRMKIGIINPTLGINYFVSFHMQPIIPPATVGGTNDWEFNTGAGTLVTPPPTWEFTSDGGVWGGTNTHVIAEADALLAHLKVGYGSDFRLSVVRLEYWDPTNKLWRRCSPFPTIPGVAGTYGSNPVGATDPALGNVTDIVLPTYQNNFGNTKVGRMPVKLPAWELNQPMKRVHGVTSTTSASGQVTANLTALIGYLAGAATRIVGHNGGIADNNATVGVVPSPRIARAAGLIS